MDTSSSSEERAPLSPKVFRPHNFSNDTSSYGTVRAKSCPPQPQQLQSNSFQESFTAKYAKPIVTRASTWATEGDEKQSQSRRWSSYQTAIYHLLVDWWLAEVLLWLISACCLFSIIIILGIHDSEPLPNHWTWNISLNTRLAILSTLAKFALSVPIESSLGQLKWHWFKHHEARTLLDLEHFDKASRGPWGSLLFLLRIHYKLVAHLFPITAYR
jgi:hypothetical protein